MGDGLRVQLDLDWRTLADKMRPGSVVRTKFDIGRSGRIHNLDKHNGPVLHAGTDCIILGLDTHDQSNNGLWYVSALGHDEPWRIWGEELEIIFLIEGPKIEIKDGWYDDYLG